MRDWVRISRCRVGRYGFGSRPGPRPAGPGRSGRDADELRKSTRDWIGFAFSDGPAPRRLSDQHDARPSHRPCRPTPRTTRRPRSTATRGDPRQHDRLAAVGALRQRPGLGHGPRGLQRRRRGLGLPAPRPRPEQGVSLGRGRDRRLVRPLPADRLRPGLLERPRPDPQGAPLRPLRARGEPRRGRQGILLLPRRHAVAFLPPVPLQVSPGRIPLREAQGRERPTRADRARVRAARHRDLRRGPLLRHRGRVRQGHDGRRRDPDQGDQPGPRARPAAPDPAPLVPQHLVLGAEARPLAQDLPRAVGRDVPVADHRRLDGRDPGHRPRRLPDRRPDLLRPDGRDAAVHRERDQLPQGLRPRLAQRARPTSRTPSTARSSTARTAPTPTGSAPSRPSTTGSTPSGPARPSPSGSA